MVVGQPQGGAEVRRTPIRAVLAAVAAVCLTLTGCAGAGTLGSSGNTVTIALVSNSQMSDAQRLAPHFEAANPDIRLKFVTLSENQARAKITASTAMGGGEFDVVMISNYEAPQWAENGWLVNLT
jgi:sorbitol/mannitol transport system substrate-binding protein